MPYKGFKVITISEKMQLELNCFMADNLCTSYSHAISELLYDNSMLKLENRRLKRRFFKERK